MRPTLLLVLLLLALLAPAAARADEPCSGDPDQVQRLDLTVGGQSTYGLYTLPAGPPRGLVMMGHGYGYNPDAWRQHMQKVSKRDGVIALAMDYRGLQDLPKDTTGYERSRGYPVKAGGEDLVAGAQYFDRRCPGLAGIEILGVSMGGNATGLALTAKAKRSGGKPLFDYWVGVEGADNIIELYQGARVLAPTSEFAAHAQADIEKETGGTFEQQPAAYQERSNVTRAPDIAASGIKGAVIVHGIEDGLAPYDGTRDMATGLQGAGTAVDFFSVGRKGAGQDPDTTLGGYAMLPTGNAGHASEWSQNHVVIQSGFDRLSAIITRGEPAPCNREFTINDTPQGVSPDPATPSPGCKPDPLPRLGGIGPKSPDGLGDPRIAAACARTATLAARRTRGRVSLRGKAGCEITLAVWRRERRRKCGFLTAKGRVTRPRACSKPLLRPVGEGAFSVRLPRRLRKGVYSAAIYTGGVKIASAKSFRVRRR